VKLREVIEQDMERWRLTQEPGDQVNRPLVLFFSDGIPSDEKESRDAAFRKLCPVDSKGVPDGEAFEWYPQIYMFGVGDARENFLKAYTFGRGFVFPKDEKLDTCAQMAQAIEFCMHSIAPLVAASSLSTVAGDITDVGIERKDAWGDDDF